MNNKVEELGKDLLTTSQKVIMLTETMSVEEPRTIKRNSKIHRPKRVPPHVAKQLDQIKQAQA